LLGMEDYLSLLNFLFMLITASAPLYLAVRLRGSKIRLLYLSIGLATFALVHSLYHLAEFLNLDSLADNVFLPLSVVLLVVYGIYYYRTGV